MWQSVNNIFSFHNSTILHMIAMASFCFDMLVKLKKGNYAEFVVIGTNKYIFFTYSKQFKCLYVSEVFKTRFQYQQMY